MGRQKPRKKKWSLLPSRTRFLAISPWLYAIITFFIAVAVLNFVTSEVEIPRYQSKIAQVLGGLILKTDSGLEIWDRNIHGQYNPALRSSRVGDLIGSYPEYEESHARGSLHLGSRITMLIEINGAPAEIETVMELLPLIETHNKIKVGAFLYQDSNGIVYFSHPDYPWRFKWSGLVWDVIAAIPILIFLWLLSWQINITWVNRRGKRLSAGICPRCRYNISNLPKQRCPECGETW